MQKWNGTDNATIVHRVVDQYQGRFCVAARHLVTGEEILYNAEELCATASVVKVPILVELMRRWECGEISLDERHRLTEEDKCPGSGVLKEFAIGVEPTLKDLATLMIIISDNTATDLVLGRLGAEAVNNTMQRMGFTNTHVTMGCKGLLAYCAGIPVHWPTPDQVKESFERLMRGQSDRDSLAVKGVPENDVTTPLDMINLLSGVYHRTLLGEAGSQAILDIMKRQQLKARIPGMLPDHVLTATKSGSLAKRIYNDVGIVWPDRENAYTVAIFTDFDQPGHIAQNVLAEISLAIYDHYQKNER